MLKKITLFVLTGLFLVSVPYTELKAHGGGGGASADWGGSTTTTSSSSSTSTSSSVKTPNVFAVLQQQGPVCPYLPFYNLKMVKNMRDANGDVDFGSAEFYSKLKGYAKFLPHIRALDDAYDNLRKANGPYKAYEDDIRSNGIKNTDRKSKKGNAVDKMDWLPTNQARRENYTPYNINTNNGTGYCDRLLPIFHHGDKLYFYNHEKNTTTELKEVELGTPGDKTFLYKFLNDKPDDYNFEPTVGTYIFTPEMERLMGGKLDSQRISYRKNQFGNTTVYLYKCSDNQLYQDEMFYDIGTYQHMLFAMGVDRNNDKFTNASPEWPAYQEFKTEMDKNPLNPWYQIKAEDLIEYQIAELFKADPELKQRAIQAGEFYNSPWKFYQDGMKNVYSNGVPLGQKTKYLAGDEQMLAYFFTAQLRFLWAATEGMDAIIEIEELRTELGNGVTNAMKMMSSMPGVPSPSKIIKGALKEDYKDKDGKFSFVDVWLQIKKALQTKLGKDKLDFVTFTGHGCIISIDDDLVETQPHQYKDVAKILGIEMWEQHYDKGFTGLHYQKAGTTNDVVKFN